MVVRAPPLAAALLALCLPGPAWAEEPPHHGVVGSELLAPAEEEEAEEEEAERRLAFEGALRVLSAYYDSGFLQERRGAVFQPEMEARYTPCGRGCLSAGLVAGVFGSLHEYPTLVDDGSAFISHFYELSWWAGVTFGAGSLAVDAYFERSTSPSGAYDAYNGFTVDITYDDEGWAGPFSLQPWASLYFEITNSLDDLDPGTNLSFGLEPTWSELSTPIGDVTLRAPMAVSLSLHDFYQYESGEDHTFGYVSIGFFVDVALPCLPGDATLELGAMRYYFGDSLEAYNGLSDDTVFSAGLVVSF